MESVEKKWNISNKFLLRTKYNKMFKGKSDSEIKWLVCQIGNIDLVELFVTNYIDMIDCYLKICPSDSKILCEKIYQVLINCPDEYFICDNLHLVSDMKLRKEIILSIDNLFIRSIASKELEEKEQIEILAMIKDNQLLKEAYLKTKDINILCAISDDEFKIRHIAGHEIWIKDQVKIICSLQNDEIKYHYVNNPRYYQYIEEITNSFTDFKYKYRVFCEHDNLDLRLNLIAKTSDTNDFNILVNLLPESIYKDIFRMSLRKNKSDLLKCLDVSNKMIVENNDLTFKLSFDVDVQYIPEIKDFTKIFVNWKIKPNIYNQNIITITSPNLKCSKEGFKEVQVICNFFKKYFCEPVDSSNLKIKFNFDYFKTYYEFVAFLMLYLNAENILNYICNKSYHGYCEEKTQPFGNLFRYLQTVHQECHSPGNLEKTIRMMNEKTESDCYSLNLLNCLNDDKMIEFKMADMVFDFEELCKTIKLFARIMEKGKFMANIREKSHILMNSIGQDDLTITRNQLELSKVNLQIILDALKEHKSIFTIKRLINDTNVDAFISNFIQLKDVKDGQEKLALLLKILFDEQDTREYKERFNSNIFASRMKR